MTITLNSASGKLVHLISFFFLLTFYLVLSFGTDFLTLRVGFCASDETASSPVLKGWDCVAGNVHVNPALGLCASRAFVAAQAGYSTISSFRRLAEH